MRFLTFLKIVVKAPKIFIELNINSKAFKFQLFKQNLKLNLKFFYEILSGNFRENFSYKINDTTRKINT